MDSQEQLSIDLSQTMDSSQNLPALKLYTCKEYPMDGEHTMSVIYGPLTPQTIVVT